MKLLFVIPLILSWNFIFWGAVGCARFLSEKTRQHNAIFSLAALIAGTFLLAARAPVYAVTAFSGSHWMLLTGSALLASSLWWAFKNKTNTGQPENSQPKFRRSVEAAHHQGIQILHTPELAEDQTGDQYKAKVYSSASTSALEEHYYARLAESGDEVAQSIVNQPNHRLLSSTASAYANRHISLSTLMKEGSIGLQRSRQKTIIRNRPYPGKHTRWWIQKAIECTVMQVDRGYSHPRSQQHSLHSVVTEKPAANNAAQFKTPANKQSTDTSNSAIATYSMTGKRSLQLNNISAEIRDLTRISTAAITIAIPAGVLWGNLNDATPGTSYSYVTLFLLALCIPVILVVLTSRLLYLCSVQTRPKLDSSDSLYSRTQVAVLIPAYNEGYGVKPTIKSAITIAGRNNVFVVNDCSTDNTSEIVRELFINQLDLQTNMGKARALDHAIKHYKICDNFQFLLILDADTEIDRNYLKYALPHFNDPAVSAVAGHAIPKWDSSKAFRYSSFFVAYRIKLYMMTQAFLRYGQTSRLLNVTFIIPGFSSIYRTSILPQIDITAPGLVIEDFNMTFELHRKRLGQIAYSPKAVAYCHEPRSLKDYTSQIKRWHLGFWQTVVRHGFWKSRFSLSLFMFILESLIISSVFITLPFFALTATLSMFSTNATTFTEAGAAIQLLFGLLLFFVLDLFGTVIVAWLTGKPALIWHGLFFVVLRWLDSVYFIFTLPMAFFVKSNGRWTSPTR